MVMKMIEIGKPFYGQNIGILVFSTTTPRVPGDAGHAKTFEFPVRYEIVDGGFAELVEGGSTIEQNLVKACKNLKAMGMKGIVGDCGLMSLYQDILGKETGLPIMASSLCLIPTVWEMIGRDGTIGIITGHSELLNEKHLLNSGWRPDIHIKIQGLQEEPHFARIVIEGNNDLDIKLMERDIINSVDKLHASTHDLKAIIFECSNIGTFSKVVFEKYQIPIFDIVSATRLLESVVNPSEF